MAIGAYTLAADVTVPAGTAVPDALNGNGSASTDPATWTQLQDTTFPKGQPIVLDDGGELYTAITTVNADALLPLSAVQETGGQVGTSN
jgi:hypothetical protein